MTRWIETEDGAAATLRRAGPAGAAQAFAEARWAAPPAADGARFRRRLARQVRQDLWRALRRVRGFSPVIEVRGPADGEVRVRAGGDLPRRGAETQLRAAAAALLDDPALRRRWMRHAAKTGRQTVAKETKSAP